MSEELGKRVHQDIQDGETVQGTVEYQHYGSMHHIWGKAIQEISQRKENGNTKTLGPKIFA